MCDLVKFFQRLDSYVLGVKLRTFVEHFARKELRSPSQLLETLELMEYALVRHALYEGHGDAPPHANFEQTARTFSYMQIPDETYEVLSLTVKPQ